MGLKELKLTNFRNFSDKSFKFVNKNLIYGKNGSGKTNLLEGIHLLCTGKSFRPLANRDFLKNKSRQAVLWAGFRNKEKSRGLSQSLVLKSKNNQGEIQKEFYREGKKIPVLKLLGKFPVILFAPEELRMAWGTPKDRRAILDLMIAQLKPIYALGLLNLSKVLRQRNKLLFMIGSSYADIKELDFWNQELIEMGSEIIATRNQIISQLNNQLIKWYQDISGTKDRLQLELFSSSKIDSKEKNQKTIKKIFQKKLEENLNLDLKNLSTTIGPHRDEPKLFLNERDLSSFGSRGEGRTAILAFKFAQKEFFEKELKSKDCLFLLDDAFSELDKARINYLLKNLGDEQSIFTATSIPEKLRDFNIIQL